MAFTLPAVKDNCNISRGVGDPKWLADINTPSNTGTKSAGSLPITGVATEFDNNVDSSVRGYAKEFENAQTPVYDVSTDTKVMLWHSQFNAPNRIQVDTVASGGTRVRIYSGTGAPPINYKEFYLGGRDTPWAECIKGQYPMIIDLNDTSQNVTSGTFDNTSVTSFAYLTARLNMAGASTNWNYQGKLYVLDTTKASANTPTFTGVSEPQDAVDLIQGSDYTNKLGNWVRKTGSIIFMDLGFRIGDNSTSTQFNDNGATIISPVSNDSNDPRVRVTTQAFRTYLNLRNNVVDTATFSGTWKWQTRANFNWDQSDSAVVTFSGPIFIGMGDFTLGSSITGNATWDDVGVVIMSGTGVDIDGSIFKNPNGTHLLQLGGAMTITDMRFESYTGNHAIEIDTAGSYIFDNIFFDGSGTNEVENTSGGAVTITLTNGSTVPGITNTGGGSTTTIINAKTVKITIKDVTDSSNIQNARVLLLAAIGGSLPFEDSVTITRVTTTATVTHTAHGLATSDKIQILGANQSEYNGIQTITVTGVNDYTYTVSGSPTTPATGTIESTAVILEALSNVSGIVEDTAFNYTSDQPVDGRVRRGTTTPLYKTSPITGTILSTGFDATVFLISDE